MTKNNAHLGTDLMAHYRVTDGRHEDVDTATKEYKHRGKVIRDLTVVTGVENGVQAIIHRILTRKGELEGLGHPEYGSRHHELIGQPNSENNRNLVKLYILQALSYEPRIETIHQANILFDSMRDRDKMSLGLTLSFFGEPTPASLVVPFSFSGSL